MNTYVLTFAYHGKDFSGWQRQVSGRTVQQVMEEVLCRVFRDDSIVLTGASRTDAGVHALEMTASFHTSVFLPEQEIFPVLAKQLPRDIRLLSVRNPETAFNAHSAAAGRAYIYLLHSGPPSLFLREISVPASLSADWGRADAVLEILRGTHDFRNFAGKVPEGTSSVRTLYRAERHGTGAFQCFYFSGNGFLHGMVRRMMGAVTEAAAGRLSPDEIRFALENPEIRCLPDAVAPARGLFLKKVFYSAEEQRADEFRELPFFLL